MADAAALPALSRGTASAAAEAVRELAVVVPGRVERMVTWYLVLFLVVFPKGGIRVAGVPLTWGYLGLFPLFLSFVALILMRRRMRVLRTRLMVLGAMVPFQLVSWYGLMAYGFSDAGFAVAFVTVVFFLPVCMVLALGIHLDRIDLEHLFRLLRGGILAVAVYGIFLFVYKIVTGEFVEIPFLTINGADAGTLGLRHNDRGGIFKLTSTYNNGNLYGVAMLVLLPLYLWLERRPVRRWVVQLSVFLSLSRTVWVGLLIQVVLDRLFVRRPSMRTLLMLAVSLGVVALGVMVALQVLLGRDLAFLFDRTLNGRDHQWQTLEATTFFPSSQFFTIYEITYLSILTTFGVAGLVTFVAGMAAPLVLYVLGAVPHRETAYKRALAASLFTYLVVSVLDGGMLNIPILAFYWFVVSLLLSDNPSFASAGERLWAGRRRRAAEVPA